MTKTWPNALIAHRDRMTWCLNLREMLLALERAGAPVPDDVGAAHADWATIHGVLRIGMTLRNNVLLMTGFPLTQEVRQRLGSLEATAKTMAESAVVWATYLREVYCGHCKDPDTGLCKPAVSELKEAHQPIEDSPARDVEWLVSTREKPYFQPHKIR